jgi:hypothetical protein
MTIKQGVSSVKATCSGLWRKAIHAVSNLGNHEALGKLGDFTTTPRIILISMMAGQTQRLYPVLDVEQWFTAWLRQATPACLLLSADPRKLVGMISLNDLLKARVRSLEEERLRERVLRLRLLFPLRNEEKINQS